jgi:hypothetical protein
LEPTLAALSIQVQNQSGKPVEGAGVIVKFLKGHDIKKLGNSNRMGMRTNQEGMVKIPPIPQGTILVQVIAKNYQTFGQNFDVDEEQKTFDTALNPPQPQYSAH